MVADAMAFVKRAAGERGAGGVVDSFSEHEKRGPDVVRGEAVALETIGKPRRGSLDRDPAQRACLNRGVYSPGVRPSIHLR